MAAGYPGFGRAGTQLPAMKMSPLASQVTLTSTAPIPDYPPRPPVKPNLQDAARSVVCGLSICPGFDWLLAGEISRVQILGVWITYLLPWELAKISIYYGDFHTLWSYLWSLLAACPFSQEELSSVDFLSGSPCVYLRGDCLPLQKAKQGWGKQG